MKDLLDKHLPESIGAIVGILLAFCFLGLGFFKTIFIILMLIAGTLLGHYWPAIKKLIIEGRN